MKIYMINEEFFLFIYYNIIIILGELYSFLIFLSFWFFPLFPHI